MPHGQSQSQSQDIAVLLVEDDADFREVVRAILLECCDASRIVAVADGAEALDYLFARGPHEGRDERKQPRFVILDLLLERVHGMEVLKAMRDDPLTQGVPVVMLSGNPDKALLDSCYGAGANSIVRKSGDPEELRRKIRQTFEFWTSVNVANRNSRV